MSEYNNTDDEEELYRKLDKLAEGMTKMADAIGTMHSRIDALEGGKKEFDPKKADPKEMALIEGREVGEAEPVAADMTEAEGRHARAEAQMRADAVALRFGEQAPPPMAGEDVMAYRLRLLRPYQKLSKEFANVNLAKLDAATFAGVENRIYTDALDASHNPATFTNPMMLRKVSRRSEAGHTVNEYYGEPKAWMNQFAGVRQRAVGDWKIGGNTRN